MTANMSLPAVTAALRRGEDLGTLTLPSLHGSASIVNNSQYGINLSLPSLRADGRST
jgi:hypothetical protein